MLCVCISVFRNHILKPNVNLVKVSYDFLRSDVSSGLDKGTEKVNVRLLKTCSVKWRNVQSKESIFTPVTYVINFEGEKGPGL